MVQGTLGAAMVVMGTPFTITPAGGQPQTLDAVFDAAFVEEVPDVGGDIILSTHAPMIGVRLSDLNVEPQTGDTIIRKGITYDITHIEPDGQGGTRLILHVKFDVS